MIRPGLLAGESSGEDAMKKPLIILIGIILFLIVLMGAAIALSPIFLNKYKDQILAKVSETVNREIGLGDIRLTLFTGVGVKLTDVRISNAKGFREDPMLTMADLDVKVKLLPLLRGEYQVTRVILNEPRLLIEKNEKGIFNFTDLVGEKESSVPDDEKKIKNSEAQELSPVLAGLLVSKVKLSDADFSYYDAGSDPLKKGLHIRNLDLELEDVSLDRPIPFSLSFGVNHDGKDIQLSGTIGAIGKEINVEKIPLSIQMAVKDFALKRAMDFMGETPSVMIESGTLNMTSDVSGDLASGLKISGATKVSSLTLKDPAKKEILVKGLGLNLHEDIAIRLSEQRMEIQKAELSVDRAKLNLKGKVSNLQKDPVLALQLSSNDIPLADWDKIFPALSGIGLGGSIKADGDVSGKAAGKLNINLNLSSPNLEVRLPKKETSEKTENKKVSGWLISPAEAAASAETQNKKSSGSPLPENIDIKGRIEIAQGKIDNIAFSELKGDYAKTGNRISLNDFSVKGFGENGSAAINAKTDFGPANPTYEANIKTSRIDLSKLQETFAARKEKIAGELTSNLTLSGAGFDTASFEKNLTADGDFKVEEGALTNVNLEEEILKALGNKFGVPAPTLAQMFGIQISEEDHTPFEECLGIFRVRTGKVQIQDAALTSKNHGFSTSGEMGFDQTLNLKARMILRKLGEVKEKKFTYYLVDDQNRKYIPFQVKGTSAKPSIHVDTDALIKGQAQQVIDEKKDELKEKLKDKLGPGGEEILKPLEKIFRF
jgi:AsmA protein